MAELGIDLGTTNSVVAHLRNRAEAIEVDGEPTVPSIVVLDGEEMLVGHAAKDCAMVMPAVVEVKRHMGTDKRFELGDKQYTPVEISSIILKKMLEAAQERLEEPIDGAVITIPAYFGGKAKEDTKQAGEMAGLPQVSLLAEPIAAALAYGVSDDRILVYDLGGGTFDVAIIDCFDYTMLSLDGNNYLGGADFDRRLLNLLVEEVHKQVGADLNEFPDVLQRAKQDCERAKIALSTRSRAPLQLIADLGGKTVNINMTVTREQFEEMISDLIDQTMAKVENAIKLAAEREGSFTKDDIDTVLLVGGSTYIPLVQKRLEAFFGRPPSKKVNPDLAVGLGAAVHTSTGLSAKSGHRLRLDPLPDKTDNVQLTITGRTSEGATVTVSGGTTAANTTADSSGKFSVVAELSPERNNEIEVVSKASNGEERKLGFNIQHVAELTEVIEPSRPGEIGGDGSAGLLPRALGVRVTGDDDRFGIIMKEQTPIPQRVADQNYMSTGQPNQPGKLPIDIYEGELPYAPFNTLLANLMLETPATPEGSQPLEIVFQITEDHELTASAKLVNFPDRSVKVTVNCKNVTKDKMNVLERTDYCLNVYGDRMRPEEKAKLNKMKQGLLDLASQFERAPSPDCYEKIKNMGNELKSELDRIDSASPTAV